MAPPDVQLDPPPAARGYDAPGPLRDGLDLALASRRPARLPDDTLRAALDAPVPRPRRGYGPPSHPASVVIVTHNNLAFTKLCVHTVLANTGFPGYELIVVDNGSADDTPAFLRELERACPNVRVACNADNRGFAAANNQALALAGGEVLVLLNNDTLVPHGWLEGLTAHLAGDEIGAVGPVTNRTCNEAQIDAPYRTYGEFVRFAADRASSHAGRATDIPMLAMFCLAMRREVFEEVGPLDERFGLGLFEDDDYSMRLRRAGYRTACAEDVFVHHFGEASFGGVACDGGYSGLLQANRKQFEEKWGVAWRPHGRRPDPKRDADVEAARRAVAGHVPAGATVAVVSKGDEELVRLEGRTGWHFPRAEDGVYAGHYPADGAAAIDHLEDLRAAGANYLLLPPSASWWMKHYGDFALHLDRHHRRIESDTAGCALYALRPMDRSGIDRME
jgi:GT2 family glycosyltransferase